MGTRAWNDMIVGDRMAVDQEFDATVDDSRFSRQQWGLIMTAVEFDIEWSGDDEHARLVADTEKLPSVMGELDRIDARTGAVGDGETEGGGVFDSLKRTLGFGGEGGSEGAQLDAAERLAQDYADQLQARLEERGRWAEVRAAAQD